MLAWPLQSEDRDEERTPAAGRFDMADASMAAAAAAIQTKTTSSEASPVSSISESDAQASLATSLSKSGPGKRTPTGAYAQAHHAHRQNHNSSKLPAFRFADLQRKQQSLTLPSLQSQQEEHQQQQQQQQGQHEDELPPSPVSQDGAPIDAPRISGSGRDSDSGSGSSNTTGSCSDHLLSPQHTSQSNSGAARGTAAAVQAPSGPACDSDNAEFGTRRTSDSGVGSERDTSENLNSCIDAPPRNRNQDSPPRAPVKPAAPRSTAHQARTSSHQQHQKPNYQPRRQQQQQRRRQRQDSEDSLQQEENRKTDEISESHPPRSGIVNRGPNPSDASASKPSLTPGTTAITSRPPSFPENSGRAGLSRASASFEVTRSATTPTEVAGSTGNAGFRHGQSTSSSSSNDIETAPGPTSIAETKQLRTADSATAHEAPPSSTENESATKEWARSQRELVLPKSLQSSNSLEDKRQTGRSRPPVSFRKPSAPSVSSGSVRVAPIRSFRSSGSRRSSELSMNSPIHAGDSSGDDYPPTDSNQRARTLRALEGRSDDEMAHATPAIRSSRNAHLDGDDTTGDVFMKIARQEPPGRALADKAAVVDGSAVSRVSRASHRRPLSTSITPSYRPNSPPRPRRLSDQSDNAGPRSRQAADHGTPFNNVGDVPSRGLVREKAASSHPGENFSRPGSGYRTSPVTPRFYNFRDASTENSPSSRRRTSITDSTGGFSVRNSAYKPSHLASGHSRTYNSSPLVPRSAEPHRYEGNHESHRGLEGTESTASTTAPSTVWDELDDLKSRIHRLELTGKLPSTSSAAINKVLDDRPTTATNTTVSTSPKQAPKKTQREISVDEDSDLPLMRDPQPVLLSAVNHSKPLLSEEVSRALENAASDATALSAMMGSAGQPGPISSGASTIGAGGTLTDRQLRRRAEGICRSLTELVLALSEEAGHPQAKTITAPVADSPQRVAPLTPTLTNKTFPSLPAPRRGSVVHDDPVERPESIPSPRAMSKLEERRNAMLKSSTLPSPRPANGLLPAVQSPAPTPAGTGRRSSLLISRTRRAATEEPEDGRRSSMLRTRRLGTEEPEEGRKASSMMRDHRSTNNEDIEDADGTQFRAPSRAATDVNGGARAVSHHFQSSPASQDPSTLSSSALPRRRIGSSILGSSRLASAASSSGAGGSRRYLERSTPDRDGNSFADKLAEDRGQRLMSTGQHNSLLNRTASLLRRPNRDHNNNSSASSQVGSLK